MSGAGSSSELRARKSEVMRHILRLDTTPQITRGLQGFQSNQKPLSVKSDKPPGLGNWDNSCYQNSILQGLSALPSFAQFLANASSAIANNAISTTGSLHELTRDLTELSNNGKRIWTPAKLKSMSSWQQQDAQEYFSRILDDVEKDLKRAVKQRSTNGGLRDMSVHEAGIVTDQGKTSKPRYENPLEGLLAQRVACVSCGHSEGLTLLPFNCLTLSLGGTPTSSLESLLDDYTKVEDIEGVECLKCTFIRQEQRLESLLGPSGMTLPANVRQQIEERQQLVRNTIADENFTDQAVKECAITKEARVSSTKTKQVVLARSPTSLAVHVNRSIFDEMTGALRKNMAFVAYPKYLSLGPWLLGRPDGAKSEAIEVWPSDAKLSLVSQHHGLPSKSPADYVLRAVVNHYGRHENGHYVCYRQHRAILDSNDSACAMNERKEKTTQWWRLSDDDVTQATEEEVLNQSGVFMLFYEKLSQTEGNTPASATPECHDDVYAETPTPLNKLLDVATEEEVTSEAINERGTKAEISQAVEMTSHPTSTHPESDTQVMALWESAGCAASTLDLPSGTTGAASVEEMSNASTSGLPEAPTAVQEKPKSSSEAPRMRTSRGKRKGASRMQPGLPTVAAQ
ncbi:hypothetical protein CAC42_2514 [Sphaceloma murrayae]|uniref:ubiquitinyl hydrolase 1 n=1 Tax=Sphaceloma murrayae TaxID=2082308 RepID=A0A2K1QWB0_9PEZI|nr:hypothetical protein CAC42_2514 [Sphaceloma murrayae]